MKTLLIPIILLFASCSKMEEIVPEHPKNVMIEVQTKNASAVVIVNDDAKSIQCDNDHCVNVYIVEEVQNLVIINTSMGEVDATVTDYKTGIRHRTGKIKNFLKIK